MSALSTRQQIKNSVLELMQTKNINEISVTSVCEKAHISRNTFYTYYGSAYDVLDEIIDCFFEESIRVTKPYASIPFNDQYFKFPHPAVLAALYYFRNEDVRNMIITLNDPRLGTPIFSYRCKKIIKQTFYEKAVKEGYIKQPDKLSELYMVAGHYELFVYSSTHDDLGISIEEMAVKIYTMMFGPYRRHD